MPTLRHSIAVLLAAAEWLGVLAENRSESREACYAQVMNEKLPDERSFVTNSEALFDTICIGCTDIKRPLIDDMAGGGE